MLTMNVFGTHAMQCHALINQLSYVMNTIKIYTLLEYMLIVSVKNHDYSSVPKKHKWVLGGVGRINGCLQKKVGKIWK